ncbi:ABC transporter permease [Lysinibacillus sp. 2017]|uniref:ABC transporter permease n=1 Tax=unclassified Lysinibacillus TaxID=2636778 RepID=UPI000D529DF6|nr:MULTISPECIES: FtsX-like permease family protein [unclassified Lysinibacillus]AWE09320.1 ABC transporter permease [Lysinibacillus sp. 2017]TGN36182.1 ABC transporter permease [Lysinibacillus sp. S2017]
MNLALANIRKSKSATASLFIFILVAALLLNIGLMVITQVSAFFDSKVEQLKDPHVITMMEYASYNSNYEEFIANYPGVTETETEEIIIMNIAKFNFGNSELASNATIFNADHNRSIGALKLIEKLNTSSANDIFIPYSFKTNGGYKLGENFTIHYQEKEYDYRIAGFFETTMMGTTSVGILKFMLPETAYLALAEKLDNVSKGLIISAVMEDKTQSTNLLSDFTKEFPQSTVSEKNSYIWGLDIEMVKNVNTLTVNIVAIILVAFATIIVLVSLIVIKYRVSNSIEDGMTNIGTLKAIGYTSRQILSSIILQFTLIAFSASVVGIVLSYCLMPLIGGIISSLSGLLWIQSFDMIVNLISIFFVTICVVIVTFVSAFRIRKVQPVEALRGGIHTHSFRKNYFPLENTRGGLHFLLGIKSMLSNAKQNIMIFLIMIALTFASVFSVVLYYNIASDKTAFVNLFGAEPSNVMVSIKSDVEPRELLSQIKKMDQVRKVNIFDLITTKIDGQTVYTNITDNYNNLENDTVYEGRQPKHENEISISWVVSNQIDKGIGDMVDVEYGTETVSFLVTGLSQSIGNLGQTASLTMEGMNQLQSDYKGTTLHVYLDGISNKDFIKNVQEQYGSFIVDTLDIDENIESQTIIYITAIFAVMLMVLTINVLVVVIILYLVVTTMITKRKKEFGVMKAIGYSTFQLMNQISISFLPVIIAGVGIGGGLGLFFTNPMLSLLLSSVGVKRLEFIIHLPIILMLCVGILFLAYIVSILVSIKIKKITAYSLITE